VKRLLAAAIALVAAPIFGLASLAGAFASTQTTTGCPSASTPAGAVGGQGAALAAQVAAAAGFTGPDLVTAVAVAGAESSYDPLVRNSIGASGLWQILQSAHPDLFARYNWRDPGQNATMAYSVWKAAGGSWTPWTTWTSGAYLTHLVEARTAVQTLPAGATGPCAPTGTQSTATPFPGPDGFVDDPTSGGRITLRMLHAYDEVQWAFGGWRWGVGCWDPHLWNPASDHPLGRACDFSVGHLGQFPDPTDRAIGWQLAHWLQANASALGVTYIIWDGHIWSPARAAQGWRPYDGGGVYNPNSPTGGHFDHVHVSVI
jgi:Lysozyme like domain